MTDNAEKIEKIRARCDAARSAPWISIIEGRDQIGGSSFIMIGEGDHREEDLYLQGDDRPVPPSDYDFIANARQDIPFLLAEIDKLKKQLVIGQTPLHNFDAVEAKGIESDRVQDSQ